VHEDVAAKDEGMRIYLCDDASAAGTNVCEDALGLCVFAQRFEVEVVDGGTLRLVQ
jgi:hypothetical protein